jgi:hypothetical protein
MEIIERRRIAAGEKHLGWMTWMEIAGEPATLDEPRSDPDFIKIAVEGTIARGNPGRTRWSDPHDGRAVAQGTSVQAGACD